MDTATYTFNKPDDAVAFVRSLRLIETGYGRYGDATRTFEIEHDVLNLSDMTWRVRQIDCAADRAWFAKHGHKAWVKRQFAALKRGGR